MDQSTQEQWRPVVGYEESHEVSNLGRVRSVDRLVSAGGSPYVALGQPISAHVLPSGYKHVVLKLRGRKKNHYVHRLVALAFCEGYADDLEVMHADGDKTNNCASNLSWGSRSENIRDQVRHGTHANAAKTHCPKGHEYTPENTYSPPDHPTWRECRVCIQGRIAARTQKRRAARNVPHPHN